MTATYKAALAALQHSGLDLAAAHGHIIVAAARLGETVKGTETTFSRYARCQETRDMVASALALNMQMATMVEADFTSRRAAVSTRLRESVYS